MGVRMDFLPSLKIHPVFHICKLKPAKDTNLQTASGRPPPPRIVDGGPVYTICQLFASRRMGHLIQYLVDWEGYGPGYRSGSQRGTFWNKDLLSRFHRDVPNQPLRLSGSRTS